jgi:hypothetical protein
MKLKWLLSLMTVCLLMLLTANLALAANPTDVAPDHWAYQAVKTLIDKGYLQLYQDQTFQGDQPVDRYTLASVVAKILAEIASGSVGATREDVKVLRNLTNELREELVKLIADSHAYAKRSEEMKRQDVVLKEDLITTNVAIQNLTAEQVQLQKEVKQILTDLSQVKTRVAKLENEVSQLQNETYQLREENKRQKIFVIIAMVLGLAGAAK